MKQFIRQYGKWIAINGLIWCIGKQLFFAIKIWGIESSSFQSMQLPIWPMFAVVSLTGLIDGIVFGLIDTFIDKRFRSLRFSWRVVSKTFLNLFAGLSLTILLAPRFLLLLSGQEVDLLARHIEIAQVIILSIYILLLTIVVQFLKLVLAWMKTQDIFEVIANPYGIEEDRIFMFLDMKASTTLAERLGPSTYSRLVQNCFGDLSEAAQSTGAEIYQYVGDEAVLTWKEADENFVNAVRFFIRFQQKLTERSEVYSRQFSAVPEFKAGIHHGKVIKAQVGMMRKEIAFHGDAINTASRIQGYCNALQRSLLVSASFKEHLRESFECTWEGKFPIRGKAYEMNLYSVGSSSDLPTIDPASTKTITAVVEACLLKAVAAFRMA